MIDVDKLTSKQRQQLAPILGQQRIEFEKPNKYRARRTEYNGVRFDSKAEANYAAELDMLKRAGHIAWVLRQVAIPLGVDCSYRVDFLVAHRCDLGLIDVRAHEVKGIETPAFRKIRRLWPKYSPFAMQLVNGGKVEIIEGKQ